MKKLTLYMVSLVIVFWASAASADRVYVPASLHYGGGNYTQLFITNLSSETVSVTATFVGHSSTPVVVGNATVPAAGTWSVVSTVSSIFGTTDTTFRSGYVLIQSSASDDPLTGPLGVAPFFVSTGTGQPSGFMTPPARRSLDFTDANSADIKAGKQYRWRQ